MMSHADEGTLQAYLDGEVEQRERRSLEQHLEECAACRTRLEEARELSRSVSQLLAELEPGAVQAPPWHELEQRAAARTASRASRPWSRPALAWAASIVLAFGIGWLSRSLWRPTAAPPSVAERLSRQEPLAAPAGEESDVTARQLELGGEMQQAAGSEEAARLQAVRSPGETAEASPPAAVAIGKARPVESVGPQPAEPVRPSQPAEAREGQEAVERPVLAEAEGLEPPATEEPSSQTPEASWIEPSAPQIADAEGAIALSAPSPESKPRGRALAQRAETASLADASEARAAEAEAWLGGELRTLPDLPLQAVELIPGSQVEGGVADRSAVRLLYLDAAGHRLALVQQRLQISEAADADRLPAMVVEPGGRRSYRWLDERGYLLILQGEVSGDSLRALAERVH